MTILGFSIALIAVFLYANLRSLSLTELNKPIHLKIFSINQIPDTLQAASIKSTLKIQGVTANSINPKAQTVSVTYNPDMVSETKIMELISLNGQFEVAEKRFAPTPVCPVPPLQALKNHVLDAFRIF